MPRALLVISSLLLSTTAVAQIALILNGGQPTQCQIALTGNVTLDPNTGDLQADGTFGTGCPTAGGSASAPTFSQALNAAVSGQSVTLSWASNASYCTTGGSSAGATSLAGWPASGNVCGTGTTVSCSNASIPLTGVPGATSPGTSYTFALQCYNQSPVATASTTAAVISAGAPPPPPPPLSCSNTVPVGLAQQTVTSETIAEHSYGTLSATNYTTIFSGDPPTAVLWPGHNLVPVLSLNKNNYLALQFTTPATAGAEAGYDVLGQIGALASLSISTCPGDFGNVGGVTNTKVAAHCSANAHPQGLKVSAQVGGTPGASTCLLSTNTTYYLNILEANLSTPTTSLCTAACEVEMDSITNY